MNYMIQIISWISDSLMLPVIILLIALFLYSMVLLGSFFSLYVKIQENHRRMKDIMGRLNNCAALNFSSENSCSLLFKLNELAKLNWHPIHCEKKIADYHRACIKDLERSKFLIKIGPMLGLMGTLIPMGPALVALANGNISSMAMNMQVAFSTTVLGIFIGAIGFVTHSVKSRWHNEEIANLQYALEVNLHSEEENQ